MHRQHQAAGRGQEGRRTRHPQRRTRARCSTGGQLMTHGGQRQPRRSCPHRTA
nr:MAG TPA: hypothetical protein [Caudoviricetes sp.]